MDIIEWLNKPKPERLTVWLKYEDGLAEAAGPFELLVERPRTEEVREHYPDGAESVGDFADEVEWWGKYVRRLRDQKGMETELDAAHVQRLAQEDAALVPWLAAEVMKWTNFRADVSNAPADDLVESDEGSEQPAGVLPDGVE